MTYIVLDMEWNQPPIGRPAANVPFPLVGEIVEFGAVKLDENFQPAERYRAFVRPHFYRRIHPYVKKITGITETTLADSPAFPEAARLFFDFCGSDCALITWGPDDVPMLCDNLLAHGEDTSVIPPAYNLQHIFNMQKTDSDQQWSLASACELLGIERQLPDHDALSDAYHTALVCAALDMEGGIAKYPKDTRPERHYTHPPKRKRASLYPAPIEEIPVGHFAARNSAMEDPQIRTPLCPNCASPLHRSDYYLQTKDKRVSKCTCEDHGEFIAKVAFHRAEDGGYDTTLRFFPMNDSLAASFEKLTQRRRAPRRRGK